MIQTQLQPAAANPGCVRIRAASARDRDAMIGFLAGLSLRTQSFRFFAAVPRPGPGLLRRMCGDGQDPGDVLVATAGEEIIGHAMAADAPGPAGSRVADIGIVVADGWQDRGIGSLMMRRLIDRAAARGVGELVMDVKPENRKMLAMIERRWPDARHQLAGDAVTIRVELPSGQPA
jgi:ribosomal protein S18 acetylase RimI-like enzyme